MSREDVHFNRSISGLLYAINRNKKNPVQQRIILARAFRRYELVTINQVVKSITASRQSHPRRKPSK